jgi:transcriptional regulator of acetoin/glycerol metabolism
VQLVLVRHDAEEKFLSALLESLACPAVIVDRRHRVRAVNAAFGARVPGQGAAVGLHCYELLHGRRRRCRVSLSDCPLERCLGTGVPVPAVHDHATARGTRRERVVLRPLLENDGNVVACLGTLEPVGEESPRGRRLPGQSGIAVAAVRGRVIRVAPGCRPILLVGEAGTGKASVARAIHRISRRVGRFEERSACELTGEGLRQVLAAAAGGTLYVGDVDALSREAQEALWQALARRSNVRVIAGTERDPALLGRRRHLRADLLARLAANAIRTIPLRERVAELPRIAARLLRSMEGPGRTVAPDALDRLRRHPFPGNLDELAQALRYASLMAAGPVVRAEDLPEWVGASAAVAAASARPGRTRRGSSAR